MKESKGNKAPTSLFITIYASASSENEKQLTKASQQHLKEVQCTTKFIKCTVFERTISFHECLLRAHSAQSDGMALA
ncbi:hypothetical protein ACO0LB_01530 [Undibacterium sp. SXout7W]|uniref:hypothetical protein n=1 Tax=Undibacterium sp. SXout7W TaxID=3413049 RepID=UPI003BF43362